MVPGKRTHTCHTPHITLSLPQQHVQLYSRTGGCLLTQGAPPLGESLIHNERLVDRTKRRTLVDLLKHGE